MMEKDPLPDYSYFAHEETSWLWPDFLPNGELAILVGAPGTHKTQTACAIAAKYASETGLVGYWGIEDSPGHIRRLIEASGGDPKNVLALAGFQDEEHGFTTQTGREGFTEIYSDEYRGKLNLLIIDPISDFIDASGTNQEIRQELSSLRAMARHLDCPILMLHHPNKSAEGDSLLHRTKGAGAFIEVPRIGLELLEGDMQNQFILKVSKSNLGPLTGCCLDFQPEGPHGPHMKIGETLSVEAASEAADEPPSRRTKLEFAIHVINGALDQAGSVLAKDLIQALDNAGVSRNTGRRARDKLRLVYTGKQGNNGHWTLPTTGTGVAR